MGIMKHDENHVATLGGISSADGVTVVPIYANATTHRLLIDNANSGFTVSSGTSAPSSTPTALGQIYIKTDTAKVYISTGTSSSADWSLVN
jgi:hypothetical protein